MVPGSGRPRHPSREPYAGRRRAPLFNVAPGSSIADIGDLSDLAIRSGGRRHLENALRIHAVEAQIQPRRAAVAGDWVASDELIERTGDRQRRRAAVVGAEGASHEIRLESSLAHGPRRGDFDLGLDGPS